MKEASTLESLPVDSIRAVFTDLDGTLTQKGYLPPSVYEALWKLHEKKFWLVLVSGRPAGWADCLMRLSPFDATLFENGAGIMTREGNKLVTRSLAEQKDPDKLEEIFQKIRTKVPQAKLASDQAFRIYDFAVDFAEEPPYLNDDQVNLVLEVLKSHSDITFKLSNIHVNYWMGKHTKVHACQALLEKEGQPLGLTKSNIVFSGDSPNDEPLFEYFDHTVGVANIRKYLPQMQFTPKYITHADEGLGFLELSNRLLCSKET